MKLRNEVNNLSNNSKSKRRISIAALARSKMEVEALAEFNQYFTNVGDYQSNLSTETCPISTLKQVGLIHSTSLFPTSLGEVEKLLGKIRNSVAPGIDELWALPIKHVASIISLPPTHIINRMLETGSSAPI